MTLSRFSQSTFNLSKRSQQTTDALAGLTPLPYTPTIGTATDGGTGTTASVAFTPNATVPAGTYYTALSSPGSISASGTSSPITVSGLTAGTAYTFQVAAVNATGSSAYSAASNSVTPVVPPSFYSIATATVTSGGASSITFSSIPQTYTHLQIRGIGACNVVTGVQDTSLQFNGDTAGNYNPHWIYTFGSSAYSGNYSAATGIDWGYVSGTKSGSSSFAPAIIDILDYKNTNKYKVTKSFTGQNDSTNSTGNYTIVLASGLWQSTSAISSITLLLSSGSFTQYTQYALYGIN
jgi:hypothetical protein